MNETPQPAPVAPSPPPAPTRVTIVEWLEITRERNLIVPHAMIPNSNGGYDPARWISVDSLNVALADLAKLPLLVARVAELEAALTAATARADVVSGRRDRRAAATTVAAKKRKR